MNLMQVKINANATSDTNDYANGSHKVCSKLKVVRVSTIHPNAGRRWISSLLLLGIVFSFGLGMLSPNKAFALPDPMAWAAVQGCNHCPHKDKCICNKHLGSQGHWYQKDNVIAMDFMTGFTGMTAGTFNTSSVFFPDDSTGINSGEITGVGYINIPITDFKENKIHYYICEVCETQKFTNFKEWLVACIEYYGYKDDAGVGEVITTPRPFEPGVIAELKKAILAAPTQVLTVTSNGDHAIVEFDNKEGAAMQFNVVDMNGLTVKTITAQSGSFTVSGLASGIYFVKSVTNPNLQAKIVIAQ